VESPEFHPSEQSRSAESMRSILRIALRCSIIHRSCSRRRRPRAFGSVSQTFYGDPNGWFRIYEMNRDKISDPNHLAPGTRLVIPPQTGPATPVSEGATSA